ncbi:5-(carboxyamino)imidazole ribonucleotide synthase [Limnofasciculus baicalensis]|uniref:N5-carboxyaminoimidazole ribonucleotide synthase n=1 Tax=Limnofasciculus baicalensis BBK-W-15 TaxID=2699891 RepID=A0AAE3GYN8_9CYAN|nr:5-(carboxyamino)imidazole ribonucleotide synthase [Limnofasciculus baicalensis]MCP2732492.1 5-(carboxyamino)imidazole ribonucleotide synthase [Limnofasciculus baicalensis BBK-W-15]
MTLDIALKRIGIIGGGQLAWMMGNPAHKLGIELVIQTPNPTDPAVTIATDTILAPIDDPVATAKLASYCDIITFENEFINLEALKELAEKSICFRPRLEALAPLLDKYDQRLYLEKIGIPQPQFTTWAGETINSGLSSEEKSLNELKFPIVIKARRNGYDGQGTFIIKDRDSLEKTWQKLGKNPVLLEEFIPFERELAVVAARGLTGEVVVYPVVETQQEEQVCRRVLVPAEISPELVVEINAIANTILTSLEVVGIFGIELFLTTNGKVLVNEVSPRTHNSGHFTIDACETSQFENHLRSVAGLPLGNTALNCQGAVMVNLLGYETSQNDYIEKRQKLANLPETFVHWYGKTESRRGRKLGHVTVRCDSQLRSELNAIAKNIESIWYS